jgi:hypothetical protein
MIGGSTGAPTGIADGTAGAGTGAPGAFDVPGNEGHPPASASGVSRTKPDDGAPECQPASGTAALETVAFPAVIFGTMMQPSAL